MAGNAISEVHVSRYSQGNALGPPRLVVPSAAYSRAFSFASTGDTGIVQSLH
jgi:hypothetical protein